MNARPASVSALFPVTAQRLATEPTEEDPPAGTPDDDPLPNLERLVAEAMALAATSGGSGPDLADLVNRFWRLVPDEELVGRAAAEMLTAVQDHRDLATQRLPGELKLHIDNTARPAPRCSIVTDDMPFLVDSVTAAAQRAQLDVHLLVHPLVVVRAGALGALLEVRPDVEPDDADRRRPGGELDAHRDRPGARRGRAEQLRNELQRVLTDVREAVEDWPRCGTGRCDWPTSSATADAARCRTRTSPTRSSCCGGWPTTTSRSSATASTSWSTGPTGELALEAVLGTGLGILRQDPAGAARAVLDDPGGVRAGAGEAAADHHQGQLAGHRAPLGLPGLHRLQDLRRGRATWSGSAGSSACSPRRRTAPACGSCRWSAARWPRCWTAPG